MEHTCVIHFAGYEATIASYSHLLMLEPGNMELDVGPLSPFQYQSCLFKNLGYDKCPPDKLWIERGLNVEDVAKTEVIDFPITFNKLMLRDNSTLFDLLMVVRNWARGGLEKGHLLEPCKSFQLPSPQEIQFSIENRIRILRSASVRNKPDVWDRADVMWRRMYNLVPTIDAEYFEYSLPNFEKWAKQIRVNDPYAAFASALIDPDILFSAIEQSEKEAVHTVWNNSDKRVPLALLDEQILAVEFDKTLYNKFGHISRIYRNRGAVGFVRNQNKRVVAIGSQQPTVGTTVQLHQPIVYGAEGNPMTPIEQVVLGTIFAQIAATPLDGDHKGVIMGYVEPYSLGFIDSLGEDSPTRIATYKRLYYTLDQLKKSNPELLNPKDKFVMSESFYIDPDRFGLYSRTRNRFYIVGLDLVVREMSPQEALEYYEVYLGRNVLLDPNELGDGFESPPVEDVDLGALEMASLGLSSQPFMVPIPIAPQQPPPGNNMGGQELYGFNPNLVES